VLNMTDLNRNI